MSRLAGSGLIAVLAWAAVGPQAATARSSQVSRSRGDDESLGTRVEKPEGEVSAPPRQALAGLLAFRDEPPSEVQADGSEILVLDEWERTVLDRWVRRGGRLFVSGAAVPAAIESMVPWAGPRQDGIYPSGLGVVIDLENAHAPGQEGALALGRHPEPFDPDEALTALASAAIPAEGRLRLAIAGCLAAYALLLGIGHAATRSFPRAWRGAGAASLVLVFGMAPWWDRVAPWNADRISQADLVVDTDRGDALVWSSTVRHSAGRSLEDASFGTGAWGLRFANPDPLAVPASGTLEGARFGAEPRAHLRMVHGSRVGLHWLADGGLEGKVQVQIVQRDGRLTGLVRNGFTRSWSEVWLLYPGFEPLKLGDLHGGAAVVVEGTAVPLRGELSNDIASELQLPPERARLAEVAIEGVVRPLLERHRPVLVAWSESPVRAVRWSSGVRAGWGATPTATGATLLVVAGDLTL
jgi:hypothetical protein